MNNSFDKSSKYFFLIAGVVTALGASTSMISPVDGFKLSTGLTYAEQSPQLAPIVGHWGIMVTGIGVLLFFSASIKSIRKTTALFSTVEKAYMVGFATYNFSIDAPYAMNYMVPLVGDSLMVLGGIWYLTQSHKLGRH